MDIREVVNQKTNGRLRSINERVNYLYDRYASLSVVSDIMKGNKLNEEDNQAQQQQTQPQQQSVAQQPQQQTQQTVDANKLLTDFGKIGQEFQGFYQTYGQSAYKEDIENILKLMREFANKVKSENQQQQAQTQQQQTQPQQQPVAQQQ